MPLQAPSNYRPAMNPKATERFALWVDGVGGYLVCLRDSVVLGQFAGDSSADVAFQADLSPKHAVIRRQNETYFVDPIGATKIDGRTIQSPTLLRDGDE